MDELSHELNNLIVSTFGTILKTEEVLISELSNNNLTISEIHLIEAAAKFEKGCTLTELAAVLKVSLPTVTVAVNRLVDKQCLLKSRNPEDTRSIIITLTETGNKVNRVHTGFHRKLLQDMSKGICDDEKKVLIKAIKNVLNYFENLSKR